MSEETEEFKRGYDKARRDFFIRVIQDFPGFLNIGPLGNCLHIQVNGSDLTDLISQELEDIGTLK